MLNKVNSSVVKKVFPVAYKIMQQKKIRKVYVETKSSFVVGEDTSYILVAPDNTQKIIRVGGEWGGHTNTNYINNEYKIPEGYYVVSSELFLGKWIVTIYTAKTESLPGS